MADEATVAEAQGNTEAATIATPASTQSPVEPAAPTATQEPAVEAPVVAEESTGLLGDVVEDTKAEDLIPESYSFDGVEGLDEKSITDLSAFAKEKGLTQAQASVAAEGASLLVNSLMKENEAFVAQNIAEFEKDPQGKENGLLAQKALKSMGMLDHFKERGYDGDYTMIKGLAGLGKLISEHSVMTGTGNAPAQAQSFYSSEWK